MIGLDNTASFPGRPGRPDRSMPPAKDPSANRQSEMTNALARAALAANGNGVLMASSAFETGAPVTDLLWWVISATGVVMVRTGEAGLQGGRSLVDWFRQRHARDVPAQPARPGLATMGSNLQRLTAFMPPAPSLPSSPPGTHERGDRPAPGMPGGNPRPVKPAPAIPPVDLDSLPRGPLVGGPAYIPVVVPSSPAGPTPAERIEGELSNLIKGQPEALQPLLRARMIEYLGDYVGHAPGSPGGEEAAYRLLVVMGARAHLPGSPMQELMLAAAGDWEREVGEMLAGYVVNVPPGLREVFARVLEDDVLAQMDTYQRSGGNAGISGTPASIARRLQALNHSPVTSGVLYESAVAAWRQAGAATPSQASGQQQPLNGSDPVTLEPGPLVFSPARPERGHPLAPGQPLFPAAPLEEEGLPVPVPLYPGADGKPSEPTAISAAPDGGDGTEPAGERHVPEGDGASASAADPDDGEAPAEQGRPWHDAFQDYPPESRQLLDRAYEQEVAATPGHRAPMSPQEWHDSIRERYVAIGLMIRFTDFVERVVMKSSGQTFDATAAPAPAPAPGAWAGGWDETDDDDGHGMMDEDGGREVGLWDSPAAVEAYANYLNKSHSWGDQGDLSGEDSFMHVAVEEYKEYARNEYQAGIAPVMGFEDYLEVMYPTGELNLGGGKRQPAGGEFEFYDSRLSTYYGNYVLGKGDDGQRMTKQEWLVHIHGLFLDSPGYRYGFADFAEDTHQHLLP